LILFLSGAGCEGGDEDGGTERSKHEEKERRRLKMN